MDDDEFDYLREYLEREECPECEGTLVHDGSGEDYTCTVCGWSNLDVDDGYEADEGLSFA